MCTCTVYVCGVCVSAIDLPLPVAAEEREKVERESLISAVTDRIKRQVRYALDEEEEMSQLIETQEKLKRGSEELNRKLQNMEDEQVRGWTWSCDSHMTIT